MTIRPARPGDEAVLFTLICELAEFEQLRHEVSGSPELLRDHLFGDRPVAEALIAETDGEAVGFALYFHSYSTFLTRPGIYLEDLYVRPGARGTGVGTALLARLASLAIDRGCGRLEWWVLDWNARAIAFYESIGATPMNEWTTYRVTGDALARLADAAR